MRRRGAARMPRSVTRNSKLREALKQGRQKRAAPNINVMRFRCDEPKAKPWRSFSCGNSGIVGQLRRNAASWCQDTSRLRPFSAQHVVTQVPIVRRNDREMIFTAAGEEIHRPADVGGNLPSAYRVESHHQSDRNTRSAEFCGHLNSGAAAQRVTDDHDRAQPAAPVLPDRVLRKRGPVAMISDRRRDAPPTHPVAELAEPRRIITQAEQHIEMRASR